MKIKELPISLFHTLRLQSLSTKQLLNSKKEQLPVIVSLTTIPSRLDKVSIVIRSILDQSHYPQKILLWLEEGLRDQLPSALEKLQSHRFEIYYCKGTYSHRKLIHTLKLYPDLPIITCDDDFIYRKNWLVSLYRQHKKFPKNIIANHVRTIQYDDDGNLLPYKQWVYEPKHANLNAVMAVGGKGVLYPPNALHPDVFNEALFLKLTPKADDLWFKAMALRNNIHPKLSEILVKEPIPILGTQAISLKKENVDQDKNLQQWKDLEDYFQLALDK